ncbi:MAG: NUDIX hydrolase [Clostridia bacterium]|nr:NUDIX hydrolase [Clostridia bacterium]
MMNYFNDREFKDLTQKYSGSHCIRQVDLTFKNSRFFENMRKGIENDRRGEVVFCVFMNNKVIAIRSKEYPEGVFRIPTGGIRYGEDIEKAVLREVKEELGIKTVIRSFEGVLKMKISHLRKSVLFYSYLFFLDYVEGNLLEDATEDEVSEVRLVSLQELYGVSNFLLTLQSFWEDWGRFRHESTSFTYEMIEKHSLI